MANINRFLRIYNAYMYIHLNSVSFFAQNKFYSYKHETTSTVL